MNRLISLFIVCFLFVDGKPVSKIPPAEAFKFMKQYGYLEQGPPDSEALYSEEAITDAIKTMQRFGAVPETGVIDNATLQLMSSKRCGVPDIYRPSEFRRRKRYVIASQGWKKRNITYFVANWSGKLGKEGVMKNMQKALDAWGAYARLNFTHVEDPSADIIAFFARGSHRDGYPFDGPGNILAHAFFPYERGHYGGDIHFDDDENWSIGAEENAVDFYTVAVHELGHSLGLGHSPVLSSIMFPYYQDDGRSFILGHDDIMGMYQLYIARPLEGDYETTPTTTTDSNKSDGSRERTEVTTERTDRTTERTERTTPRPTTRTTYTPTTQTTTNTPTTTQTTTYSTTNQPTYTTTYNPRRYPKTKPTLPARRTETTTQTSTSTSTEPTTHPTATVTYEGDYETVDEHKEHEATTKSSSETTIPDICEGNFDAVGVLRGELFIFKNEYLWRLKTRGIIEPGYPTRFRAFFQLPDYVKKIDATYQRPTDGHIIIFAGNKYWDFNGDKFVNGSPRPLTDYGLPRILDRIDAAQVWGKNGKTYLYHREMFWRYNETTKTMDPGYPHHIRRWRGVPQDLDAATTWNDGFTYFFKGKLFWRFDNYIIKTDEHYPLPAPQNWLGCPEKVDTFWWLPEP